MFTRHLATAFVSVVVLGLPAFADPVVTDVFQESASSAQTGNEDGQVAFVIDETAKTITVTLTNLDQSTLTKISESLVGVTWTFDAGNSPGTLSLSTTTPATSGGELDCSNAGPCTNTGSTSSSTNYGWGVNTSGLAGSTPNLFAGNGSGHPLAILTNTTNAPGGNGGLSNDQHTPYLLGPVSFTISYTGTVTSVDSANLYFGTSGANVAANLCPNCTIGVQGSTVPEPTSLILMGSILLGVAGISKKFKRAL